MTDTSDAGGVPVSALTADTVVHVDASATLLEAADALASADIGAVVIGPADGVTGIVSERDVVRALAARKPPDTTTVGEIATTALIWCDATATIAEVAQEMMDHYVRHILVEDDGRLVGIVSARDLLGAYAASDLELADEGW
jgi:CBS domain-containing protein